MKFKNLIYFSCLVLLVCIIYGQLYNHEFLNLDDHVYVTANSYVTEGLSSDNLKWAFRTTHAEFYHPLTWLSLMLDTSVFGVTPRGYLFTNVLLHLCNSFFVFLLFYKTTSFFHRSWVLALLFAVHPLHVESVAWISDRKDLLCGLFWLMTILSYSRYSISGKKSLYGITLLLFFLALLSKPTAVMIPITLVIFDYWPLGRFNTNKIASLTLEKVPFFVASLIIGILTMAAQSRGGGIVGYDRYPFSARLSDSFTSVLTYIKKAIAPYDLAIFYPIDGSVDLLHLGAALLFITTISVVAVKLRREFPFLLVGWLWFILTLLPVIGIIKVGDFAVADRYMYLPILGLLVMVVWGAADIFANLNISKAMQTVISCALLGVMGMISFYQVSYWERSELVYRRTLFVEPDSYMAHYGLAKSLSGSGKDKEVAYHLARASELAPDRPYFSFEFARYLAATENYEYAHRVIGQTLKQRPHSNQVNYLVGLIKTGEGQIVDAIDYLSTALLLSTEDVAGRRITKSDMDNLGEFKIDFPDWWGAKYGTNDIAALKSRLQRFPSCLPIRLLLAEKLAQTKDPEDALAVLFVERSDPWLKKALSSDIKWWLSRFPDDSLESLSKYGTLQVCQ